MSVRGQRAKANGHHSGQPSVPIGVHLTNGRRTRRCQAARRSHTRHRTPPITSCAQVARLEPMGGRAVETQMTGNLQERTWRWLSGHDSVRGRRAGKIGRKRGGARNQENEAAAIEWLVHSRHRWPAMGDRYPKIRGGIGAEGAAQTAPARTRGRSRAPPKLWSRGRVDRWGKAGPRPETTDPSNPTIQALARSAAQVVAIHSFSDGTCQHRRGAMADGGPLQTTRCPVLLNPTADGCSYSV